MFLHTSAGNDIDARTRASLWERGWDYRHGTGHGIGAFLQVHEGPARLGLGYQGPQYEALYAGMFFSDGELLSFMEL